MRWSRASRPTQSGRRSRRRVSHSHGRRQEVIYSLSGLVATTPCIDVLDCIVLPAIGIPGQNSILSDPCNHLLNSGESRNHCPMPSCLQVMISCCWAVKSVGDSHSIIAWCCCRLWASLVVIVLVCRGGRHFECIQYRL